MKMVTEMVVHMCFNSSASTYIFMSTAVQIQDNDRMYNE